MKRENFDIVKAEGKLIELHADEILKILAPLIHQFIQANP